MKPSEMFDLSGKVAVIPGGGGAIGSPWPRAFRRQEPRSCWPAGRVIGWRSAWSASPSTGGKALAVVCDATRADDASRLIDETVAAFGRVDIVVNAIGGGAGDVLNDAESYPEADWDWIMDLNVRSTLLPTQAAVRRMVAQGDGWACPQHLLGTRPARDRRRLLRLRGRQGRDRRPDPAMGDGVGQARNHRQCHLAHLRRHASGGFTSR